MYKYLGIQKWLRDKMQSSVLDAKARREKTRNTHMLRKAGIVLTSFAALAPNLGSSVKTPDSQARDDKAIYFIYQNTAVNRECKDALQIVVRETVKEMTLTGQEMELIRTITSMGRSPFDVKVVQDQDIEINLQGASIRRHVDRANRVCKRYGVELDINFYSNFSPFVK